MTSLNLSSQHSGHFNSDLWFAVELLLSILCGWWELNRSPLALRVCPVDDVLVHFGAEEARVRVLFHQAVDLGLDLIQAGRGGLHQEGLLGLLPRAVVNVNLSRRLHVDELLVDPVGFGGQFSGALGLLIVLTGHPELYVLIAEL